jgi:hypothetical protein
MSIDNSQSTTDMLWGAGSQMKGRAATWLSMDWGPRLPTGLNAVSKEPGTYGPFLWNRDGLPSSGVGISKTGKDL